jgi:hypothetical protein
MTHSTPPGSKRRNSGNYYCSKGVKSYKGKTRSLGPRRLEDSPSGLGPVAAGQPFGFAVRVRNTGTKPWRFSPVKTGGFKLGFYVRDDQDRETASGYAGLLDGVVHPGEDIELNVVIPSISRPGRYRLLLDMVDPEFIWFSQMGSELLEEELVIRE